MQYFVLISVVDDDTGAVIESLPDGCPPQWRMHLGESLLREFPAGAPLRFSSNYPDRRLVLDFVTNTLDLLIVSPAVRRVFENAGARVAEFLPVHIVDHRGGVVGPEYSILNLVGSIDAVDMARTRCTMGAIDKTQIFSVDSLAIDARAIPADAVAFRLRNMLRVVLVREDLAAALAAAKLTGFRVFPAEGWDGLSF